jgi:hypothetical protein
MAQDHPSRQLMNVNGLGIGARMYKSAIAELFSKAEQTLGGICLLDAALCLALLIRRARAFDMTVCAIRRHPAPPPENGGLRSSAAPR